MQGAQNLKGQDREDALVAFYDCKALMMTHYQNLHGGSPQRDISYLLALQRLLTIDLGKPPEELKTFGLKSRGQYGHPVLNTTEQNPSIR